MTARWGVCSWSLQPSSATDLAEKVRAAGLSAVQLALDSLRTGDWPIKECQDALGRAGIAICSGMMVTVGEDYSTLESIKETGGFFPDEHWEANLIAAGQNAALACELGISLVTFHAGFLPHERGDAGRGVMIERLRAVIDRFEERGIRVAFETGQERADTLLDVLDELDRPEVGVNFDPANMILYGLGDPVEALRELAPRVVQIHIKDATATKTPGTWGVEVPVGSGEVDWPAFFEVVRSTGIQCDYMIEREAGDQRVEDVGKAREFIEPLVASKGV